ncbi:MAG: hypothetical protein SF053_17950 [Bacteroidia bacterium]|nr:hypothetical protein [Bacteroidia bacterium]
MTFLSHHGSSRRLVGLCYWLLILLHPLAGQHPYQMTMGEKTTGGDIQSMILTTLGETARGYHFLTATTIQDSYDKLTIETFNRELNRTRKILLPEYVQRIAHQNLLTAWQYQGRMYLIYLPERSDGIRAISCNLEDSLPVFTKTILESRGLAMRNRLYTPTEPRKEEYQPLVATSPDTSKIILHYFTTEKADDTKITLANTLVLDAQLEVIWQRAVSHYIAEDQSRQTISDVTDMSITPLASASFNRLQFVDIAVDNDGNGHIVSVHTAEGLGNRQLWYAYLPAATHEVRLQLLDNIQEWHERPLIGISPQGMAWIAAGYWADHEGGLYTVCLKRDVIVSQSKQPFKSDKPDTKSSNPRKAPYYGYKYAARRVIFHENGDALLLCISVPPLGGLYDYSQMFTDAFYLQPEGTLRWHISSGNARLINGFNPLGITLIDGNEIHLILEISIPYVNDREPFLNPKAMVAQAPHHRTHGLYSWVLDTEGNERKYIIAQDMVLDGLQRSPCYMPQSLFRTRDGSYIVAQGNFGVAIKTYYQLVRISVN